MVDYGDDTKLISVAEHRRERMKDMVFAACAIATVTAIGTALMLVWSV